MNHANRALYRLADQLRSRVQGLQRQSTHNVQAELDSLLPRMQRIQALRRRLDLCERFHLPRAAERINLDLQSQVGDLSCDISQLNQSIYRESHRPRVILSLRDSVQDLEQLKEEFGDWEYDSDAHVLSVTTEAIQLEGVYLGSFTIRLMLDRLGDGRRGCYDVVATDPHPPARNEHITHPHVSDDRLCEGNAGAAIHAALQAGRFCDFFLLVQSVLTTYNPDSPYVKLEHWEGQACTDCGHIVDDDDRYYCEGCENDFCSSCISSCRSCDLSLCGECLSRCSACDEHVCSNCLKTCSACGGSCCKSCLDEDDLCPTCQETQEQENDHETPGSDAIETNQLDSQSIANDANGARGQPVHTDATAAVASDAGEQA